MDDPSFLVMEIHERTRTPPVGSKGTVLSLMTQELHLDHHAAGKNIQTRPSQRIVTPQSVSHNNGVSLSCRGTLLNNVGASATSKFRHSCKRSGALDLMPTFNKSVPHVRKKYSYLFNQSQPTTMLATDPSLERSEKSKSRHGASNMQKKYVIAFEKKDLPSLDIPADMPVQTETKRRLHDPEDLELIRPILGPKLDSTGIRSLLQKSISRRDCNDSQGSRAAPPVQGASDDRVAAGEQLAVKVVEMGCRGKGGGEPSIMRSLLLSHWFAISPPNDHPSLSFSKLQKT